MGLRLTQCMSLDSNGVVCQTATPKVWDKKLKRLFRSVGQAAFITGIKGHDIYKEALHTNGRFAFRPG